MKSCCLISDSHTDFLTSMKSKEDRELYIKECVENGVNTICCAVFMYDTGLDISDIAIFNNELKELSKRYNINLLLTIEDLGFVKNSKELQMLIKIRPFSVTLTWNFANQFAGGAKSDKGLTELGREVIWELENNNILIDTAHLNGKSFWEFAEITKFPIFNSHSNIDSLHNNPRNLTDKQIERIVDSNGYLGITIYDEFVAGRTIDYLEIVKQFQYLINKFGSNNFGLGTDLYGIEESHLPKDLKGYKDMFKLSKALEKEFNKQLSQRVFNENLNNFINRIK